MSLSQVSALEEVRSQLNSYLSAFEKKSAHISQIDISIIFISFTFDSIAWHSRRRYLFQMAIKQRLNATVSMLHFTLCTIFFRGISSFRFLPSKLINALL